MLDFEFRHAVDVVVGMYCNSKNFESHSPFEACYILQSSLNLQLQFLITLIGMSCIPQNHKRPSDEFALRENTKTHPCSRNSSNMR